MILNALVEKLKRRSKDDFKGRHYEATLILQAVSWYLRYPLSYRDIEELFLERGLEVDHSTLNRWVLAYTPLIERQLRGFHKPPAAQSGSTRHTSRFAASGTARRTIQGFEAMLWLRKGFGFAGAWTVCEQNRLLARRAVSFTPDYAPEEMFEIATKLYKASR